jgi:hypothetical protein
MTNHGLTEEDTRDIDRWRNLVLGEGRSGQTLYDDDDDDDDLFIYIYDSKLLSLKSFHLYHY